MRTAEILIAFLGGFVVGASLGSLFDPAVRERKRNEKIKNILRDKGVRLEKAQMEDLVKEIASEVKDKLDD